MLTIYNTLTRKKEEIKPINENIINIYTCGPTVHNYAHIGNYRSFLAEDLLIRYLIYKNYKVNHVMNITDVEDKIIQKSREYNKTLKEYTEKYIKAFFEEIEILNIRKADIYPKATEHIEDMINLIKRIEEKGYTYRDDNNSIYFKIDKYKEYGKLSKLDINNLKRGASGRISSDEYDKENASDFVLWKGYNHQDGNIFWNSPFGKGRPGWHIECSAMSMKYFGESFDMHTGGIDNMFPHHENEIAQSETATGKKYVNHWMHIEHLLFKNKTDKEEKMSKSLGNVVYIKDLLEQGYNGKTIRFALISNHYRQILEYSKDRVEEYKIRLNRYQNFIKTINDIDSNKELTTNINNFDIFSIIDEGYRDFEYYMDDDLNISGALSSIDKVIANINKNLEAINKNNANKVIEFFKKIDSVLGIFNFSQEQLDREIEELIKEREKARENKEYKKADEIRDKLKKMGIVLEDTNEKTKWRKI